MKSLILLNDENINKLITTNDYLNDVIKVYINCFEKNNLLVSSVIELFDFIKRINSKKLISYLFEKHYDFIYNENNKNIYTFQELVLKYENGMDQYCNKIESDE
jgi:protein phosphatase-4 regulatory subunit 3